MFAAVPVATHNQRGIGSLHIGLPEGVELDVDARDLLHIVEQSMSSEIYELMKRSDEVAVVEKAHLNPRFVEDCVREMVRRVAESFPQLGDGGFVLARQENLETIHRHSVFAERIGLLAEIVAELESGEHSRHHMTEREWLEAPCAPTSPRRRPQGQPASVVGGRAGRPRSARPAAATRRSNRRRRSPSPRPPGRRARPPRWARDSR